MTGEILSETEIDRQMPDAMVKPMLQVITAFARLDTTLSAWLLAAYGISLSRGAMLIENMDVGNKINRLKKLYDHGDKQAVEGLKDLKREYDAHKDVRHTIAHAAFAGVLKDTPTTAVFSPARTGDLAGQLQILMIPTDYMLVCAQWADTSANGVIVIYEKLEALRAKSSA